MGKTCMGAQMLNPVCDMEAPWLVNGGHGASFWTDLSQRLQRRLGARAVGGRQPPPSRR
eukprot:COSAG01_NODE_363_length_18113_cov_45.041690_3_plen_59_part_00